MEQIGNMRPGNIAPLEELSLQWQAVGNTVSNLTGPRFNPRPPAPETNALPLETKFQIIRTIVFLIYEIIDRRTQKIEGRRKRHQMAIL